MFYKLPASKILILLLVIPSFFAISVIASISNLWNFQSALQVSVMLQPALKIFATNI